MIKAYREKEVCVCICGDKVFKKPLMHTTNQYKVEEQKPFFRRGKNSIYIHTHSPAWTRSKSVYIEYASMPSINDVCIHYTNIVPRLEAEMMMQFNCLPFITVLKHSRSLFSKDDQSRNCKRMHQFGQKREK